MSIGNKALRSPRPRDLVALQEFTWGVWVGGYEWARSVGPEGLPGVVLRPEAMQLERVEVRVHPGLFVDFAQVRPTRQGILEFVYLNGLLGLSDERGEPQAVWRHHIGRMKQAVELARSKRPQARPRAAEIANDMLREHVDYQLMPDADTGVLRPRCVPRCLLGAMWLQFACTVDTAARFEPCAVCGKTMLVAPWLPGGRRGQSKYCSNACNQKMKRMKARARLMLAEGAGRRRVAKELGVTETWLRERKL